MNVGNMAELTLNVANTALVYGAGLPHNTAFLSNTLGREYLQERNHPLLSHAMPFACSA